MGCVEASSACVEVLELFFNSLSEIFLFDFEKKLGKIWQAKMEPKIDFGKFFLVFLPDAISASISGCF